MRPDGGRAGQLDSHVGDGVVWGGDQDELGFASCVRRAIPSEQADRGSPLLQRERQTAAHAPGADDGDRVGGVHDYLPLHELPGTK